MMLVGMIWGARNKDVQSPNIDLLVVKELFLNTYRPLALVAQVETHYHWSLSTQYWCSRITYHATD